MNLNDYQQEQQRTWNVNWPIDDQITNAVLGLAGEAGELADHWKKVRFHQHPLDKEQIKKEAGDCFHYVSAVASLFGFTLEEVAQANIGKLRIRYPNGFTVQDSIERKDVNGAVDLG